MPEMDNTVARRAPGAPAMTATRQSKIKQPPRPEKSIAAELKPIAMCSTCRRQYVWVPKDGGTCLSCRTRLMKIQKAKK